MKSIFFSTFFSFLLHVLVFSLVWAYGPLVLGGQREGVLLVASSPQIQAEVEKPGQRSKSSSKPKISPSSTPQSVSLKKKPSPSAKNKKLKAKKSKPKKSKSRKSKLPTSLPPQEVKPQSFQEPSEKFSTPRAHVSQIVEQEDEEKDANQALEEGLEEETLLAGLEQEDEEESANEVEEDTLEEEVLVAGLEETTGESHGEFEEKVIAAELLDEDSISNRNKKDPNISTGFVRSGVPSGASPKGSQGIRDGRFLKPASTNTPPIYPRSDRFKKRQGRVVLLGYVNDQGFVRRVKLESSTGSKQMNQNSIRAFSRYRFQGGQKGWVRLPFQFVLR